MSPTGPVKGGPIPSLFRLRKKEGGRAVREQRGKDTLSGEKRGSYLGEKTALARRSVRKKRGMDACGALSNKGRILKRILFSDLEREDESESKKRKGASPRSEKDP